MNSTNEEKETSVREQLIEAIERGKKLALESGEVNDLRKLDSLTLDFELVVAARDRIDELEQKVENLEMDLWESCLPY
jgi:hypothetical protein